MEKSRGIRFGAPNFDGSFISIRRGPNGNYQLHVGWDGEKADPPRPGAGGLFETTRYSEIAAVPDPTKCGSTEARIEDLEGSQPLVETFIDSEHKTVDRLTGIIGNAAIGNLETAFFGLVDDGPLTKLSRRTSFGELPFEAESLSAGCDGWVPVYEVLNASTSGDVVLLPAARAAKTRCFISGIRGDWSVTNSNGTVQSFAEIYYGSSGDVRLRVVAADPQVPVSASASCIRLRP
ncbi:hypothetical protein AKJ09_02899 [Labilithrix luteola]|uniref:Uncharacterized protein n=1 Tax=Labilithrix luteola TaxID=1391654 RepID=A0A0K1PRS5_9BACT|nr:hypothetical protein [Labilithrix luteola]AKU96235.1 hypothetical protein AKJ09_02899 [Labilithrix luteola]